MARRMEADESFGPDDLFDQITENWRAERKRNKRRKERNRNVAQSNVLRGTALKQQKQTAKKKRKIETRRLGFQQQRATSEGEARRARLENRQREYARSQGFRESQQQYRQQRDAQRQAYQAEADRERAERRNAADRQRRRAAAGGPSFSTGQQGVVPSGGGWSPNKSAVAKFIIFATALGALGTLINSTSGKSPDTVQQINGVTIPTHLRSLAGTFIAGAVALIVNEMYPAGGAVLGAGIVGLIVIPNWTPALARIGALSFTGLPVKVGGGVSNLPGNKFAGPGGLVNPAVPWKAGSKAPAPFQGQSGQWEHKHYVAGNADLMPPGDYWIWVPNG